MFDQFAGLAFKGLRHLKDGLKMKVRLWCTWEANTWGSPDVSETTVESWMEKLQELCKQRVQIKRQMECGCKLLKSLAYFSDAKSWIQITIMENVLQNFIGEVVSENRKVTLFLDNATAHPETK